MKKWKISRDKLSRLINFEGYRDLNFRNNGKIREFAKVSLA